MWAFTRHSLLRIFAVAWRNLARRVDALWGYDIFIAHRISDAGPYAKSLYDALQGKKISCFIDRVVYVPGDSLLVSTRRHVAKSSVFVLLGSPEILNPRQPVDWVEREIDTYLQTHEHDPKLLVVDFGGVISQALLSQRANGDRLQPIIGRVEPFIRELQDAAALTASPSGQVVDIIPGSFANCFEALCEIIRYLPHHLGVSLFRRATE
jgi:hypothetical protein